jgi:5'-nucleotidase
VPTGHISITPIQVDLPRHPARALVASWVGGLEASLVAHGAPRREAGGAAR